MHFVVIVGSVLSRQILQSADSIFGLSAIETEVFRTGDIPFIQRRPCFGVIWFGEIYSGGITITLPETLFFVFYF